MKAKYKFCHIKFDNKSELLAPIVYYGDFNDFIKNVITMDNRFIVLCPLSWQPGDDGWTNIFEDDEDNEEGLMYGQIHHSVIESVEYMEQDEIDFWYSCSNKKPNDLEEFCYQLETVLLGMNIPEENQKKMFTIQ